MNCRFVQDKLCLWSMATEIGFSPLKTLNLINNGQKQQTQAPFTLFQSFFSTACLLGLHIRWAGLQGKEWKRCTKNAFITFIQYTLSELTWVMEPPLWEIEESEWILVPGMPLVILPPWTAGIAAARIKGKRSISSYNEGNVNKLMPTVVSPTFFKNLLTVPFYSIIQKYFYWVCTCIWAVVIPQLFSSFVRLDEHHWTQLPSDFQRRL